MTVFERKTRFGGEETGVEVYRKSRKMLDFFADSPNSYNKNGQIDTENH